MYQTDYFVLKESGTYSNALEAFGFAAILSKIVGIEAIQILDDGPYFRVCSKVAITEELIKATEYFQAMHYIRQEGENPTPEISFIDLQGQRTISRNLKKFRDSFPKPLTRDAKNKIKEYEPRPHTDYEIFSNIFGLTFSAGESYKKVFLNIFSNRHHFSHLLTEILYLYSQPEDLTNSSNKRLRSNTIKNKSKSSDTKGKSEGIFQAFDKVNALQLFNPHQGKGVNASKANGISLHGVSAYWLQEFMKMMGCYKAMTIRGIKITDTTWDTKVYVLNPQEIDLDQLLGIQQGFKPKLHGISAVKLDISSLLNFCVTFIQNLEEYKKQKKSFSKFYSPHHFVNGFHTAYFKSLGRKPAVSNLAFLQLPTFISIKSFVDGQEWIQIIQEHESILRTLREDATGSCIQMLHNYRLFLTSSDIEYFFEFLGGYSAFLMQEIAKENFYVRPFSLKLMEELIMRINTEFAPILRSDGFRNIASAIRRSTISLMYTPRQQRNYEVKYGMAQELKQKSDYRDELIKYLSDFCASYNNETARVKEKKGEKFVVRATVKQQDIEEVVRLIDSYGSGIVGRLLAAYGYALERKDKIEKTEEEIQEEAENV